MDDLWHQPEDQCSVPTGTRAPKPDMEDLWDTDPQCLFNISLYKLLYLHINGFVGFQDIENASGQSPISDINIEEWLRNGKLQLV